MFVDSSTVGADGDSGDQGGGAEVGVWRGEAGRHAGAVRGVYAEIQGRVQDRHRGDPEHDL